MILVRIFAKLFPQILWLKDPAVPFIYLTFDDGPHPEFTPQILEILNFYDARATFFLIGKNVQQYPHIVYQIYKRGHSLGNHSFSHQNLLFKSTTFFRHEFLKTNDLLQSIIHSKPTLFRPPYGYFSPTMLNICRKAGITVVMWSLMTYDFNLKQTDSQVLDRIKKHNNNGAIYTFHDGHKNSQRTINILPQVIELFKHNRKTLIAL